MKKIERIPVSKSGKDGMYEAVIQIGEDLKHASVSQVWVCSHDSKEANDLSKFLMPHIKTFYKNIK
jgi:hypothetical protein